MVIKEIEEFVKTKRGKTTYKSWLNKYFDVIGIDSTTYFTKTQNYDLEDRLEQTRFNFYYNLNNHGHGPIKKALRVIDVVSEFTALAV